MKIKIKENILFQELRQSRALIESFLISYAYKIYLFYLVLYNVLLLTYISEGTQGENFGN
jgi:hypothetical protein